MFIRIFITNAETLMKISYSILTLPAAVLVIRYMQIIQYIQMLGVRFELINSRLEEINLCKFRLNTRDSNFSEENVYNEKFIKENLSHFMGKYKGIEHFLQMVTTFY